MDKSSLDTAGWQIATGHFDEFKAGFEHMLYFLVRYNNLSEAEQKAYRDRFEIYLYRRMTQSVKILYAKKEYSKAASLYRRLTLWKNDIPEVNALQPIAAALPSHACAQDLIFIGKISLDTNIFTIHSDQDDETLHQIAQILVSEGKFKRISINEVVRSGLQRDTLVLIQNEKLLEPTLKAGFPIANILEPRKIIREVYDFS